MSLTKETIAMIKQSSGLIELNASKISENMYTLLFDLYPQHIEMFDNAPSNQHELLAETISLYAVNIDNLAILKPVLEKISRTHENMGVQEKHYAHVLEVMLLAFKNVLKDKATVPLLKAWEEAILFVSSILIKMEKEPKN
ncbi:hypothetical protein JHD50_01130 [Sulfurimonas sp. MAG313]|nr:globin domain-containing protein [Sulfurimonas sp. MAG313]MDF1879914.1 hypothetical protein [Sulfurimonas sp. MAG313]